MATPRAISAPLASTIPDEVRVLRLPQVAEALGLSERAVRILLATGALPRVQLTTRAVGVRLVDLRVLLAARTTTAPPLASLPSVDMVTDHVPLALPLPTLAPRRRRGA